MRRLVQAIAPARMGTNFRWLIGSQWSNNLGDGLALAAGPLLLASLTDNLSLIALATVLQRAPWFLFGLFAGTIADRTDRRRLIITADIVRGSTLLGLAVVIALGQATIPIVLTAMFLLGTAETFIDTTTSTLLPMVVDSKDLGVGNARMAFGRKALNNLIGPPLGAALIAAGLAVPFVAQAVLVGFAALSVAQISVRSTIEQPPSRGVRADIAEGVRWLWAHPAVRTLAITILCFNITFGAVWPLLVVYSSERLGFQELGFGLLLSASAVGGLVGASAYGWLERRVALANLMRVGLIIETLFHLGLALTSTPAAAMAIMFSFGAHATIWGTTATTIRQRAVPEALQGRVSSVYYMSVFGSMVLGGLIGASLAGAYGVLAPFWFSFVGSSIFVVVLWPQMRHIAHEADEPTPLLIDDLHQ